MSIYAWSGLFHLFRENSNIVGVGTFGLASSRIAKVANAAKQSEYRDVAEALGRVIDTKLWAAGLPMTIKDVMETLYKEKTSLTAFDQYLFQNTVDRQQVNLSNAISTPNYQGVTNPVNYNQIAMG